MPLFLPTYLLKPLTLVVTYGCLLHLFAIYYTISFIFLLKNLPHFDPCVRPVS